MATGIVKIRTATPEDAKELLRIYAPYVERTAVSFEYDVPKEEVFRQRIVCTLEHYPWLVAESEGQLVGYAYASQFHERAAYSHCVEMSIYVKVGHQGKGVGRALYTELEHQLRTRDIQNLYACIAWAEGSSEYLTRQSPEFHAHMGYQKCAHFHHCGYKFGQWFDMIWMEKIL